jgi:GNAT superfamily N-acetyltransferase
MYDIVVATAENGGLKWLFDNAKREGWEPGFHDLDMYSKVDPNGFFVGMLDGNIVGGISAVAFDDAIGFIGYYIVDPAARGNGFGLKLFQRAMEYMGSRNIGLDGLLVQVPNYEKNGFKVYHNHARYQGCSISLESVFPCSNIVSLDAVGRSEIVEFDKKYFPVARVGWIEDWIALPGGITAAYVEDSVLKGFGVLRPCVSGFRLAPLYADNMDIASKLLANLRAQLPDGSVFFMDIPTLNVDATRMLTEDCGMIYLWECSRMYTSGLPDINWAGTYGLSSLELG